MTHHAIALPLTGAGLQTSSSRIAPCDPRGEQYDQPRNGFAQRLFALSLALRYVAAEKSLAASRRARPSAAE
jgi:hypothetical protein